MKRRVAVSFLTLALTATAYAHKVSIFAYVEGERVYTESYFVDGSGCSNCKILVYALDGTSLLEGQTDAEGLFDFATPDAESLRIVVEAGMGHRNEYQLILDGRSAVSPSAIQKKEPVRSASPDIEQMLDRKLAPLTASIDEMRKAPSVITKCRRHLSMAGARNLLVCSRSSVM